ncbi:MAG: hypothetical protein JJ971_04640 [Balneolaceae bacterium]|nr:hypothetical protein [Balneolaceae bacterium]MBO6545663.1 hypothetical protein [Balneolaceae bacterium]MBO6647059.1 hypothetical protein [Balneolaceae bacterium]
MSSYALTDETAIDILIFWIASTDGSISFAEQGAVKRVLENMNYTMNTYHKTMSQIGAMSTDHVKKMIEEAIVYIRSNFSDDGQRLTYSLLDTIAHCEGGPKKDLNEKLERLKKEWGV